MRTDRIFCGCLLALAGMVILAFAGIVAGRVWVFDFYRIPQDGMWPTMPAGSFLFAWRRPYAGVDEVERGDVVVYVEERGGQRHNVVWRVIGLPGDEIELAGRQVFVDGRPLDRQELRSNGNRVVYRESVDATSYEVAYDSTADTVARQVRATVPPGHLFLLGDNRDHAYDSEETGPIPFGAIVARVP